MTPYKCREKDKTFDKSTKAELMERTKVLNEGERELACQMVCQAKEVESNHVPVHVDINTVIISKVTVHVDINTVTISEVTNKRCRATVEHKN